MALTRSLLLLSVRNYKNDKNLPISLQINDFGKQDVYNQKLAKNRLSKIKAMDEHNWINLLWRKTYLALKPKRV